MAGEDDTDNMMMYDDIATDEDSDDELRAVCRGAEGIKQPADTVAAAVKHRASVYQLLQDHCRVRELRAQAAAAAIGSGDMEAEAEVAAAQAAAADAEARGGASAGGAAGGGAVLLDVPPELCEQSSSSSSSSSSAGGGSAGGEEGAVVVVGMSAMEWSLPHDERTGLHDPKRIQDMQLLPAGGMAVVSAMHQPSFRSGFGVGGAQQGTERARASYEETVASMHAYGGTFSAGATGGRSGGGGGGGGGGVSSAIVWLVFAGLGGAGLYPMVMERYRKQQQQNARRRKMEGEIAAAAALRQARQERQAAAAASASGGKKRRGVRGQQGPAVE